jgi:phage baseplate assembly protein W
MAETKSTKADIPHFALPLRYLGGKPIVNEQDSWDDVYDCVQAIARYPRGFREDLPDFGISSLELTVPGSSAVPIQEELEQWEPRIALHSDAFTDLNTLIEHIIVEVPDPNA